MNFRKLLTYFAFGTAAVMPFAGAQNPTILQGNYITNVFGNSNFVLNPNAQTNVANVTVSSATVTRSTTTPLVATSEFNITTSTSTGYADWSLRVFDEGMKNNNCEARFTYRGFSVGTTTAQILQGANVVAQLTLTASTDPRIASINFPCGDLSAVTKFRLQQATASLTGTNEIGGIYVGLATNMANVAQAEVVVQAARNSTQTVTSGTTATILWNNKISDTFGEYDTATGLFTAKRAGIYEVNATVMINALSIPTNARVDFIIWKNSQTIDNQLEQQQVTSTRFWKLRNSATMTLAVGDVVKVTVSSTSLGTYDIYNDVFSEYNKLSIKRFPSSSELVVTPERQNVFGGVRYSGSVDAPAQTALTSETILNTTNFGTPAAFGKAQISSLSDCGLVANDIGFCMKNVPAGTYQFSANIQLGAVGALGTPGQAVCNAYGTVTGTSLSATKVSQGFATNGSTTTSEDWTNLPTGLITIPSFQSNLAVYITRNKTTSTGGCLIRSAASSNVSLPAFQLVPVDQPSNSALYVQGPVLASQTGAAIPAGYVGQKITGAGSNVTPADVTWTSFANTSALPAGVYQCIAYVTIEPNNGSFTTGRFSISTANNTVGTTQVTLYPPQSGNFQSYGIVSSLQITSTGSTTAYANVLFQTPTGAIKPSVVGSSSGIECTRLN